MYGQAFVSQVLFRNANSLFNELWYSNDVDTLRWLNRGNDELGYVIVVTF